MKKNRFKKSDISEKKKIELLSAIFARIARDAMEGSTGEGRLHGGTYPSSLVGDYSDVYVITPYGSIPWNNLSKTDNIILSEIKNTIKESIEFWLNQVINDIEIELSEDFVESFRKIGVPI
jgi:hypothetical protein